MTIPDHDSSEVLCQEIIADARRERDEILNCARQDAEALLGKAGSGADEARRTRLEEARAEGAHRRNITLAAVFVETRRLHLARIEELLESVRSEVQERLASRGGFDYRQSVINLAGDAIRNMMGDEFTVRLAEEDRSVLGGALADEILARIGRPGVRITISYEPNLTAEGPIVEDASGRQVWDNRYSMRLERLWPQLRRRIAGEMFPAGPEGFLEGGNT